MAGSCNDAGIWSNTSMFNALECNKLSLPQSRPLPHTNLLFPYALVGDEGFPLKKYLLRPYARRSMLGDEQRVFNYRLSRARRVVENAFGILASKWQILNKPISLKLETAETLVHSLICMHNYLISTNEHYAEDLVDREDDSGQVITGAWRINVTESNTINPLGRVGANVGSKLAMKQRDILAKYFTSEEGSIPWQWRCT